MDLEPVTTTAIKGTYHLFHEHEKLRTDSQKPDTVHVKSIRVIGWNKISEDYSGSMCTAALNG